MSLSAIQDNLVKVNLVQQTQTKTDDVARGQEIHQAVNRREQDRQQDEVVLMTQQKEEHGIRDEERERGESGRKKKRRQEEEEEEKQKEEGRHGTEQLEDDHPRARMRKLNILA